MRNNLQKALPLAAAFVAGALVFMPFLSRAEPAQKGGASSAEIVFSPADPTTFLVRGENAVYLFQIQSELKAGKRVQKLVQLDYAQAL